MKKEGKESFQIKVITSDVTYMKEGYCVAGWNPSAQQMKRLLINGNHWEDKDLKQLGKYASLLVNAIPAEHTRSFPHLTEDIWIDESYKIQKTYDNPAELARDLRESVCPNIQKVFQGNLKDNSYVSAETKCPSLGAIVIPSNNIEFFKKDGKLRAKIIDNDKAEYNLPVTCKYLRDLLDGLNDLKEFNIDMQQSGSKAHVRIGVAKPYFYKNNNCYLMCNGVFFYQ